MSSGEALPYLPASTTASAVDQNAVLRRAMWRLVPFIFISYVFCYIDRVNVGFAALSMNHDIGLSATQFGFGSGLFFIGYFLFEIPSNLMMQRFGARIWIARIMITWGCISVLSAFAKGPVSFGIIRFLLGLAEAGFTPGTFLFFTMWFPGGSRAKATALFLASVPVANIVGSLISGTILSLGGIGPLRDWQTLIVMEAVPAIVLGVLCLFMLADRPRDAAWLNAQERDWLESELRNEQQALASRHGGHLRQAFTDWKVFVIAGIYFCYIFSSVGIGIWLPQIVKEFGLPNAQVGLVAAIPYACGAVGMLVWSKLAGEGRRRVAFAYGALIFSALTLAISAFQASPVLKMLAITLTVTSMLGFQAIFLSLPSTFLTGRAAAGGLAVIVSIGNLGGFAGPYLVGYVREATHSYVNALLVIAAVLLTGALSLAALGDPAKRA